MQPENPTNVSGAFAGLAGDATFTGPGLAPGHSTSKPITKVPNGEENRSIDSETEPAMAGDHAGILWCLRSLRRHCRRYEWHIGLVLIAVLVESCFIGALPLAFKHLVDETTAGRCQQALIAISWGLGFGVVLASLAGLVRNDVYARVVAGTVSNLRERMFRHLQTLSLAYFRRTRPGETTTRFSADISAIENSLATVMPLVITPGLDLLVGVVLLFWLDWRLACVAMWIWPLAFVGPRFVMPRALRAMSSKVQLESRTLQWVQETLAGQIVVKAFGLGDRMNGVFRNHNAALRSGLYHLHRTSGLVEKTSVIGIWILQALVLVVGAWMTHRGWLTIGTLGAFQTVFMNLANSLYYISQYTPALIQAGGALQHIEDLLSQKPELADAPESIELPAFQSKIELDNVSFSYTGERLHLDRVNLSIPRGSSVAFVGTSGSGKSTIANLLLRLYDPSCGEVRVDGHDLTQVAQRSWRRQVCLISQDNFLFNLSIRENIRHGNPSATEEQIIQAARAAEIHDAIVRLPRGYDTIAGECGSNLSGGQRQRVAIARALVANPAVLILDEATSALDPATEAQVNRTLLEVGRGRTVIALTHRLESVTHFDQICVFDAGHLVEKGCHEDLMARRGAYYKLWRKQSHMVSTDEKQAEFAQRRNRVSVEAKAASKPRKNSLTAARRHSGEGRIPSLTSQIEEDANAAVAA